MGRSIRPGKVKPEGSFLSILFLIFGPLTCHTIFLLVHAMLQIDSTLPTLLAFLTSYIAVPASYFYFIRPRLTTREKNATDDGFIRLVSAVRSYPSNDAGSHRDSYWEAVAEAIPHGRMKDTGITSFFDIYHRTHGAGNINPDTFFKNRTEAAPIFSMEY